MIRKKAIEIVRNIYQTDIEKEALSVLIPELAESKDERIRRSLVEHFSKFNPADMWDDNFSFSQILAYLEKQISCKWLRNGYECGKGLPGTRCEVVGCVAWEHYDERPTP
jgi:hypothetical protein